MGTLEAGKDARTLGDTASPWIKRDHQGSDTVSRQHLVEGSPAVHAGKV